MFSRRSEEPLNGNWTDDALAKAVEQALDVAPAPDFVARVRTRVAEGATPAQGWYGWRVGLGAAGLAVCLASATTWVALREGSADVTRRAVQGADRTLAAIAASESATGAGRTGSEPPRERALRNSRTAPMTVARRAPDVPRDTTGASGLPQQLFPFRVEELRLAEVVIAPAERRAIQVLLNPPAPETVARAEAPADEIVIPDLLPLGDVVVPGIQIATLVQAGAPEGDEP